MEKRATEAILRARLTAQESMEVRERLQELKLASLLARSELMEQRAIFEDRRAMTPAGPQRRGR